MSSGFFTRGHFRYRSAFLMQQTGVLAALIGDLQNLKGCQKITVQAELGEITLEYRHFGLSRSLLFSTLKRHLQEVRPPLLPVLAGLKRQADALGRPLQQNALHASHLPV